MIALDFIIKIALFILVILQIGLMIYLFILNYKREKEDKKFWETLRRDLDISTEEYKNALQKLQLNGAKDEQTK